MGFEYIPRPVGMEGELLFAVIYRRPDGKPDLRPENPTYPAIVACGDEIERMALALEKRPGFWCPVKETRRVRDEYAQEFPEEGTA